jgi:hypothetical protein
MISIDQPSGFEVGKTARWISVMELCQYRGRSGQWIIYYI